jgi:hypothetical protein
MSYVENLVNNLGKKEPFKAFTLRIPESQANLIEEHALRLNVHRQTLLAAMVLDGLAVLQEKMTQI